MRPRTAAIACFLALASSAAAGQDEDRPRGWSHLWRLRTGAILTVETCTAPPTVVRLLRTDGDALVVFNPFPALPQADAQRLWGLGASVDRVLDGRTVRVEDLEISPAGIARNGTRLAALDAVVGHLSEVDVREIRGLVSRGSPRVALVGAASGLLVGGLSALSLSNRDCGRGCEDERLLIGASVFGLPILGGVLGYSLGRHEGTGVIYRGSCSPRARSGVGATGWRRPGL